MNITNRLGLPEALVAAVQNDPYDPGDADISITRLLAPPKQVALMKQHADELTEDVADRIWALRSQGLHCVLERAADENELAEIRWNVTCLGWKVSGKLDLVTLKSGVLTDWKDTSVWSIKDALDPTTKGKVEWEQQVNLLAYFGKRNDHPIKAVQVVAFGRDWRKNEKLRFGDDYPDHEVSVIPLPLWSTERAQLFLEQRVTLHRQSQAGAPPECTPEERWEQPTTYAVMSKGRKSATRLYQDRALAEQHAANQPNLEVKVRPGKSPRCQQYCAAMPFCAQGQAIVAATQDSA